MDRTFERVVSERMRGKRLDHYLLLAGLGTSRNQALKLIAAGRVLVSGKSAKPSYKVKPGDHIRATFEVEAPFVIRPEPIPLKIAYEDSELIVVDKPPGMVVHPARGHSEHTLVNALLYHCKSLPAGANSKIRPGVLHRLDKDTTGLIVFAKADASLTNLGRQVESRRLTREYRAVVWGDLGLPSGTIDAPVGRSTIDRKRMAVTPFASRTAVTGFEVLERFGIATLVRVRLQTGRTHQIRVHMAHYGHPVLGDPDYGGRSRDVIRHQRDVPAFEALLQIMKRQALHAAKLGFTHPVTARYVEFESPLPEDMEQLLTFLRSRHGTAWGFPRTGTGATEEKC
jgi:23S rRNA pseudouridine1911/1915/1917 synthase